METDDELCPALSLTDDVGTSTSNRSVGTLVQFVCSSENFELVGPRLLYCTSEKTWNGTIPYCTSFTDYSTSTLSTNVTGNADESFGGLQVGTVVIVLWCCGGALLLTLIILMACILQSHKKGRTINRSNLFPGRQPRHGGVNPTFTSYDEIWTWIPVVTDSQNNCNSQIYPSARESSAPADTNISTVTLPSYENAVRQSSNTVPRNSAQNNENPRARDSENHYDTIPVDTNRIPPTTSGVATAPVSRPSNALSALTAALQSPLPDRRVEPTRREAPRRGNNRERRHRDRQNRGRECFVSHVEEIRERSQQFYRQYNSRNHNQRVVSTNPGFRHSESSMFSYYGDSGRRIYCDIPPTLLDEDAPPPYNNNNYESQNGNRPVASAPIMRLDYDYF